MAKLGVARQIATASRLQFAGPPGTATAVQVLPPLAERCSPTTVRARFRHVPLHQKFFEPLQGFAAGRLGRQRMGLALGNGMRKIHSSVPLRVMDGRSKLKCLRAK
jgi:hypothetical protein